MCRDYCGATDTDPYNFSHVRCKHCFQRVHIKRISWLDKTDLHYKQCRDCIIKREKIIGSLSKEMRLKKHTVHMQLLQNFHIWEIKFQFMPNGKGYEQTKAHFESMKFS